jgi:phage tail sheath protein FI
MATSYLSPGVYVEEVPSGSKPIEAVGTSTAGFIGECDVGPINEPILCTNWSTYTKHRT